MPVDRTKIAQLEKELEEARRKLWKEDAERSQILMREMAEDLEWILRSLTERRECILFGLQPPEAPSRARAGRSGISVRDMECPLCGKRGLTKGGLGLHMARIHKEEKVEEPEQEKI